MDVELNLEIVVESQIQEKSQTSAAKLTDDSGKSCAGNFQSGESEQTENQNGVHNDVDNGAGHLCVHGENGTAG